MKRFYKIVSIEETKDGHCILLDGKPIKVGSGTHLCAPNEAIAKRIMQEWAEQEKDILPDTMPFTQILNTKLDRVSTNRIAIAVRIFKYIDTDLLYYFTDEPPDLLAWQIDKWSRWITWFEEEFSCKLKLTDDLMAISQDIKVHDVISKHVSMLDDDRFTILQLVTSLSGSIILALALTSGAASAKQVLDACFVEEDFKAKIYDTKKHGIDVYLKKKKESKMRDFEAAQDYIALL